MKASRYLLWIAVAAAAAACGTKDRSGAGSAGDALFDAPLLEEAEVLGVSAPADTALVFAVDAAIGADSLSASRAASDVAPLDTLDPLAFLMAPDAAQDSAAFEEDAFAVREADPATAPVQDSLQEVPSSAAAPQAPEEVAAPPETLPAAAIPDTASGKETPVAAPSSDTLLAEEIVTLPEERGQDTVTFTMAALAPAPRETNSLSAERPAQDTAYTGQNEETLFFEEEAPAEEQDIFSLIDSSIYVKLEVQKDVSQQFNEASATDSVELPDAAVPAASRHFVVTGGTLRKVFMVFLAVVAVLFAAIAFKLFFPGGKKEAAKMVTKVKEDVRAKVKETAEAAKVTEEGLTEESPGGEAPPQGD